MFANFEIMRVVLQLRAFTCLAFLQKAGSLIFSRANLLSYPPKSAELFIILCSILMNSSDSIRIAASKT